MALIGTNMYNDTLYMLALVNENPYISGFLAQYQIDIINRWTSMVNDHTSGKQLDPSIYLPLQNQVFSIVNGAYLLTQSRINTINYCLSTIKNHPNRNINQYYPSLEWIVKLSKDSLNKTVPEANYNAIVQTLVAMYNELCSAIDAVKYVASLLYRYNPCDYLLQVQTTSDPILIDVVDDASILSDTISNLY